MDQLTAALIGIPADFSFRETKCDVLRQRAEDELFLDLLIFQKHQQITEHLILPNAFKCLNAHPGLCLSGNLLQFCQQRIDDQRITKFVLKTTAQLFLMVFDLIIQLWILTAQYPSFHQQLFLCVHSTPSSSNTISRHGMTNVPSLNTTLHSPSFSLRT